MHSWIGFANFLARSIPDWSDTFVISKPSSSRRPRNMVSEQAVSRLIYSQLSRVGIPARTVSTSSALDFGFASDHLVALLLYSRGERMVQNR